MEEGEVGMSDSVNNVRNITLRASKGHYLLAHEAEEARRRRIEEKRQRRKQELQEQQEIEWKAFQDATRRCLKDAHLITTMEELQFRETLHSKYSEICKAHEEEMEAYTERVVSDEARRPMTLSPLLTLTRAREKCLASARLYGEAAKMQALFSQLEECEHKAAEEHKQQMVERRVREKWQEIKKRSFSSYQKVFFAQQLKHLQSAERMRAIEANLRHKASEMAVSHHNQRQALHLPLLDIRSSSKAHQLRSSRGSQLKQKVNGDHYYVPSLCDMYGSSLEHE
ncbi:hypothetical protein C3747_62g126 [Trypanosoma cruzi]|uniref:Uncharacterized protein n=2 Tax=Trypanosoma cruzi TaxID=5693 RepID=Q4DEQ5_TRYCC|nr:uncharacterized protein Tc00.1047053506295.110 [Trypanosoma cruzi]EAN91010.1 hypothetical protein, conserved [Trypanosoma cruzi]PWV11211.1 hypothetical protein C3747_62g126 [Trypanosoma cruzi]|eukprot:XP_812861.1 hypothetical protein Tc00.1047053506295.110 [Trypanosoma cruzi strain CL Brener]